MAAEIYCVVSSAFAEGRLLDRGFSRQLQLLGKAQVGSRSYGCLGHCVVASGVLEAGDPAWQLINCSCCSGCSPFA